MKHKNKEQQYFRVITDVRENEADLYLYGYIGQDFWWDEDLNEESLTDLAVVKAIRELEKQYNRINVRINSPGGSVMHGDPIITALRNSKAEVHTYIDGIAASMAFDIWLAGGNRHVSLNSKAMCHATSTIEFGTAKQMRQAAERLDKFDEVAIKMFSAVTGMDENEVKGQFYDYEDHWLTSNDLKELGLVEKIEDYDTELVVSDPEKLSYVELLQRATKQPEKQEKAEKQPEKRQKTQGIDVEALAQRVAEILHEKMYPKDDEDEETDEEQEIDKETTDTTDAITNDSVVRLVKNKHREMRLRLLEMQVV